MARKVFISILGTGYYLETKYHFGSKPNSNEKSTRFIQENTITEYCKDWGENDKILIFLTKEAREKNWIKKAQEEHPNGSYIGLSKVLSDLNLKAKIKDIDIEDGFSEEEIWKIFDTVYKQLEFEDEVYFDITHAFRYLPMLSMVLINYAKFLHNIKIKAITYGAFEKLGPAYKVKDLPLDKRFAPILDLLSFSKLQDWTSGANEFINFGNAEKIKKLLNENKEFSQHKTNSLHERSFQEILDKATKMIYSVRGFSIYQGEIFDELNSATQNMKFELHPFIHIFDKVKNELNKFSSKDKIQNGFLAIEWCIRNNLIQQGLTLLEENIITAVLLELGYKKKKDLLNSYKRERIASAFFIKKNNIQEKDWKGGMKDIEKGHKILKSNLISRLSDVFDDIREVRNDINHAGWRSQPMLSNEFKDFLINKYAQVKQIINQ